MALLGWKPNDKLFLGAKDEGNNSCNIVEKQDKIEQIIIISTKIVINDNWIACNYKRQYCF